MTRDLFDQQKLGVALPEPLAPLARIAANYRWSWLPGGPELFRSIDPFQWEECRHNPIALLRHAPGATLDRLAADSSFVARVEAVDAAIRADLDRPFRQDGLDPSRPVAFLCAEFAIHRSLPVYAGGLGVLAGDILKEASDLALPFVGVGLLYGQGYLHQQLDPSGWQREYWDATNAHELPAELACGDAGEPLSITVTIGGRDVHASIWRVDVGRVPLYLLDANRPDNAVMDRWITARLYVGERRLRLAQYALLGIGGIRALRAVGVEPGIVHLNEGHAAFGPLELARGFVERGRAFDEALEEARSRTIFTTHTPLPAGNEAYDQSDFRGVLGGFAVELGADVDAVVRLGREEPDNDGEAFGLTPLGLRVSRAANGVSRVHGGVARAMWQRLFDRPSPDEVPINHVTNGVHVPTWMSAGMQALLDRHLRDGWRHRASDPAAWAGVDGIPDEELWALRTHLRSELVAFVRERVTGDRLARGETVDDAEAAARLLDPDTLTIGFARRAASYKRLSLLIHDRERTVSLLGPGRAQLVLAGKAHPQDEEAKRVVQDVFSMKWDPRFSGGATFLEDYDVGVAAILVAGCDVWLNVPRAPLEASGTSGMKSALNGGLNASVLDGWWAEAFDGTNGWGIASDPAAGAGAQDEQDAASMYEMLEREVLPLFYDRDDSGIPRGWVARIKASLRTIGPRFCATRMLEDYIATAYRAPSSP